MKIRESAIEAYLVRRVKQAGGVAYKWVSPGQIGVPDRIVMMPGGWIAFVELKATGGIVNAMQARQHVKLMKLGMRVLVIDSMAGVDKFVDRMPALKTRSGKRELTIREPR